MQKSIPTTWTEVELVEWTNATILNLPLGPLELLSAQRWFPITLIYDKILDVIDFKETLRRGLDMFPIFAGRLQRTQGKKYPGSKLYVEINPTNNGIQFYQGINDLVLDDLVISKQVSSWNARESLTKMFLPPAHPRDLRHMISQATPLLHVSMVFLSNGSGTVLTFEFAHCIGDAASFYTFIQSLSKSYQVPSYSPNIYGPYNMIQQAIQAQSITPSSEWLFVTPTPLQAKLQPKGTKIVSSRVFWLTEAQLADLKARIADTVMGDISTNDMLVSLVWHLSSALPGRVESPSQVRMLLNFRSSLGLHPHSIGNMIYSILVQDSSDLKASQVDSIPWMAKRCREAIHVAKSHQAVESIAKLYHVAPKWSHVYWNEPQDTNHIGTYTTNLTTYNFTTLSLGIHESNGFTHAIDQLESSYGAFPFMFQFFSDIRGGVRIVAHLPPDLMSSFSQEFIAVTTHLFATPADID